MLLFCKKTNKKNTCWHKTAENVFPELCFSINGPVGRQACVKQLWKLFFLLHFGEILPDSSQLDVLILNKWVSTHEAHCRHD